MARLETFGHITRIPPHEACDLDDLGIVAVRVGPAFPSCATGVRTGEKATASPPSHHPFAQE